MKLFKYFFSFVTILIVTISLILFFTSNSYNKNIKANINEAFDNLSDEQLAIKATAYSFFDKGEAIQYDNSALTFLGNGSSKRGLYYFNPESASIQNKQYTVCSSFIYQVFYNTFINDLNENYVINYPTIGKQDSITSDTRSEYMTQFSNPNTTYKSIKQDVSNTSVFNEDLAVFYMDSNTYYKKNGNDVETTSSYFVSGQNPTADSNGKYNPIKAQLIREDILSLLQPGDVLNYYSDTNNSGHVLLYLGDNEIIESQHGSAQGNYDFYNLIDYKETSQTQDSGKDKEGNLVKGSIKTYFLTENSGYSVLGDGNGNGYRMFNPNNTSISIIRPLNEIYKKGFHINNESIKRMNYYRLFMEKTASVNRYDTVEKGQTIDYKINLKNNSNTNYNNVVINDSFPSKITLLGVNNNNCSIADSKLTCELNISSGEELEIIYRIRVDENYDSNYIESKNTEVNGIKLTNIITNIGKTISNEEQNEIINRSKENKSYSNIIEFINYIFDPYNIEFEDFNTVVNKVEIVNNNLLYSNSTKGPIKLCENVDQKNMGLCNYYSNISQLSRKQRMKDYNIYWVNINDDYYGKMYVHGRYGGLFTLNNSIDFKYRMNYIEESDFMFGDLLLINDENNQNIYVYLGNNTFKTYDNNQIISVSSDFLDSLIGMDNFIILRPSLLFQEKNNNQDNGNNSDLNNNQNNEDKNDVSNNNTNNKCSEIILESDKYYINQEKLIINNVDKNDSIEKIRKNITSNCGEIMVSENKVLIYTSDLLKEYSINRVWFPNTGNKLIKYTYILLSIMLLISIFIIYKRLKLK